MLHIENEYKIPIDSNCYQNNTNSSNPEKLKNSQNTINFNPHIVETNSNMKNNYQKTINKIQPLKEQFRTIPLLLKSLKNKQF